jgi:hypothetical protein
VKTDPPAGFIELRRSIRLNFKRFDIRQILGSSGSPPYER